MEWTLVAAVVSSVLALSGVIVTAILVYRANTQTALFNTMNTLIGTLEKQVDRLTIRVSTLEREREEERVEHIRSTADLSKKINRLRAIIRSLMASKPLTPDQLAEVNEDP